MTLDEIRGESLDSRRFAMQLLIWFAVVASTLALGGIYGVLSLSVVARRREIAIRTALGADRRCLIRLIVWEGARLIAVGVVAGLAAARGPVARPRVVPVRRRSDRRPHHGHGERAVRRG